MYSKCNNFSRYSYEQSPTFSNCIIFIRGMQITKQTNARMAPFLEVSADRRFAENITDSKECVFSLTKP